MCVIGLGTGIAATSGDILPQIKRFGWPDDRTRDQAARHPPISVRRPQRDRN